MIKLEAALQGPGALPPSGYGSAYGLPPFGMSNAGNLGGALPFRPLDGGPPNWLLGSPPLGSGASGGGKPHTFAFDQAWVAFITSYLQGIVLDYYTAILCFNLSHPLFTNWQVFVNKFSSKFRVFDMVAEAEKKLVPLRMSTNKCFTAFVVQFEKESYKTGWNYNALRFQFSKALPKHIHNVLQLTPK
ncbi:hypothetical protein C0995_001344 [Termitomyces sp. Mi166|nr:hypothetical protein C0995_001344 [Termitomyces sp. Mi166\